MTILWFTFLIIDKHLVVISLSLRKNIKEDLKINGRYHAASTILKNKCSRFSTDIIDKLITAIIIFSFLFIFTLYY